MGNSLCSFENLCFKVKSNNTVISVKIKCISWSLGNKKLLKVSCSTLKIGKKIIASSTCKVEKFFVHKVVYEPAANFYKFHCPMNVFSESTLQHCQELANDLPQQGQNRYIVLSKKNKAKMLVNILLKRFAFTLKASSVT